MKQNQGRGALCLAEIGRRAIRCLFGWFFCLLFLLFLFFVVFFFFIKYKQTRPVAIALLEVANSLPVCPGSRSFSLPCSAETERGGAKRGGCGLVSAV